MKGNKNTKWMVVSWICFGISILSKSASITLPVIFAFMSFKTYRFSKAHLLIPFFLLSIFGTWKLLVSRVAVESTDKTEMAKQFKATPQPVKELKKVPEVQKLKKNKKKKLKKNELPPPPAPPVVEPQPPAKEKQPIFARLGLIAQTMNYYFWQAPLPVNNVPVKSHNYELPGYMEWTHLIFLLILVIALWKDIGIYYLAAAHILLLPFLGFIYAPFMTITWVSDQHLYLVMPAFIGLWLILLDKLKWKYAVVIPSFFVVFFGWKTFKTVPLYHNDINFYEACIDYDENNVPMSYNLALAYYRQGDINKAFQLAESVLERGIKEPKIRNSRYYPGMFHLYLYLKTVMYNAN
jgi:tetratricopeptide (TPR) repeat protein